MAEDVRAEIVASVLEVVVSKGDQIGQGDTLVLLESMKMEIPVLAEVAGTVTEVSVSVGDVIQAGDSFRVTLRVLGGTVTHLLKMPSAKDVFEYRRGFARVLDLPYNRQELIINLAPAGALFTRLAQTAEGYAGEVPVIHQAVAVKAAIDALDAAFQETADPN